jgi:hypothetical protein
MNPNVLPLCVLSLSFAIGACTREADEPKPAAPNVAKPPGSEPAPAAAEPARQVPPQRVKIHHVLISFAGRGTAATRTQAEAEKLAADVAAQAEAGGDFKALMKQYSDDTGGGVYTMFDGPPQQKRATEYLRNEMVPAFGDVGFTLDVGEIGVAPFDPKKSPYGWHIIQRIE